jgi:hypothetical protein
MLIVIFTPGISITSRRVTEALFGVVEARRGSECASSISLSGSTGSVGCPQDALSTFEWSPGVPVGALALSAVLLSGLCNESR